MYVLGMSNLSDASKERIDAAIKVLNEMVEADREAVQLLIETRVPCNDALADHPTVQVHSEHGRHSVGLLGVINGLLGADTDGWGFVCASFDDKMQLIDFKRTPPRGKKATP